ncbi:hypothetical protein RHGRI_030755 [Rhododendron griersonianum]|uniref:Uncharacterized protein n=1 Tax=Rhododendron griersonianum TaxID=479676 RepID=A0AAV6I605_9ERIC|nr:hypothetical protein RHGRI_030755 [Rhododendron griersonianum]
MVIKSPTSSHVGPRLIKLIETGQETWCQDHMRKLDVNLQVTRWHHMERLRRRVVVVTGVLLIGVDQLGWIMGRGWQGAVG